MKGNLGIVLFFLTQLPVIGQYKSELDFALQKEVIAKESQAKLLSASTGDCEGAIALCGGIYSENSAPPGIGNVYEYTGACNQGTETMTLWYTFTVQEAGAISFIITPADNQDDYDWGLFDITNGGCPGIVAQDNSSPEVSCNSYGSFNENGPTGISTANGGTGTSNGPGDLNGPAFNADIQAVAGQTFALVVMNWSNSQNGYNIDFTQSTATIYDQNAEFSLPAITCEDSSPLNLLEYVEGPLDGFFIGQGISGSQFNPAGLTGNVFIGYTVDSTSECDVQPILLFDTIFVSSLSQPVVFEPSLNLFCISKDSVELLGGMPANGFYSGPGVFNNSFSPSEVGVGEFIITYSIINGDGCAFSDEALFTVEVCTEIESDFMQSIVL